ncbi:MAG: aspartate aminotransferase [Candidatus Doudnabacteria bacterium RIFCSPLOWO2_02_FULL_49_13]|uniref:Aminotransferase n=1 Tax=Candidatus Doudnabacteria bacterium RIFCSPHIGHO2_12_FULL_48_16 TaxID=1817838 RepID=A0A1F5PKM6_9BACT|nr:MAG: aspartate aminotransferase [Candidatus Doudnabacteria bacterium RIFCSPHIGHO2_02_FULL_49_24]OGE88167.1 MAG: aspartate aminotransferase [Candidatus Doudnabacteria bacterium RIFCSPHIGHO2_01_FULL_50_67]OGE90476.1 MAG: aspartate aminotransferase [Candidatus Doudnabacteria bacterium RIFCSPHIGHO2_12_FULL_48_16]OGE96538.1 MAG: aspartate aminotransferase [Candidatus Doudnabacteria bacterium RIFCSPLOWO2_01_FULL_49_40]OGF02712.1 MAG: aspartate aminotransferase [Candidatus Doudnabacteria bacterium 
MKLKPFKLERYFDKYEFSVKHLLSSSDSQPLTQEEVLQMAGPDELNLWNNLGLGYTESKGLPVLREEIAKLYKNTSASQVLVVTPEEGIFITMSCLLKKDDHIISTFPGYQSLYEVADGIGCEITKWHPEEKNGWRFSPEFLNENIKPSTKAIIFNFPHNPTGYLPSQKEFSQIIDIARQHNLWVFSDEMYRFLEFNAEDRLPSACEVYEKAITLCGMSKSFGMPGIRIGWLITQDGEFCQELVSFKDYTTICSSAPSEVLALIGLKSKEKILLRQFAIVNNNLKIAEEFFRKYPNLFSWIKPKAGTISFPKLLFTDDAFEFCETLVQKIGIMLLPSTVYDYGNNHVRFAFGRKSMQEALKLFEGYLKENVINKV